MQIYDPMLQINTNMHCQVYTTENGVVQARLYLSGSEVIVGIPYPNVPGQTFREKRAHVQTQTVDQLVQLARDKNGFVAEM